MLIFLIKFLIFLKRLSAALFVNLALKPIWAVLKFLFHKILVRLYLFYLSIAKRFGLAERIKNKSAAFFVNQKSVHLAVAAMTVLFVIFNLTQKTQAVAPDETAGRSFLAEIISSEYGENDELTEEYFDEQADITPVQQTYLDNLTAFKPQPMAAMTAPADEDSNGEDLAGSGDALKKPDLAATTKTRRLRSGIIDYTVEIGDTVSTIAANFGISVNTILWENDLTAYSLIRPGEKLAILPVSGIAHKVARGDTLDAIVSRYGADANAVLEANKLASAEKLAVGQKLIIPGGQKIYYAAARRSAKAGNISAVSIIRDLLKPKDLRPAASNKLAWPTVGARITQYFSWRHYAIDVANRLGTPIYATDAGVVEVAGWGRGYGNQIVIDHGGGRKSRYAHLSKFYVKKGEAVNKGETVAAMGSTGYSTGSHVHFEYIINGVKYNPLNYLK